MVVGSLDNGGTERHLLQVLPALDRARFRPEVFALQRRGVLANRLEAAGVPVRAPWISGGRDWHALLKIARLMLVTFQLWAYLLVKRPGAVHMFLPASYLLGMPAACMALVRRRLMSRRSRNHYQQNKRLAGWFERRWHRLASAIVGNSQRVMDDLLHDEKVPPGRAALIYNGVEPMVIAPDRAVTRAALGISAHQLVIVMVANLIAYKGHRDLIDACGRVTDRLPPDWRLLIVGRDDGIEGELADRARRVGIAANVQFLGERDDAPALLVAADIGVLASHEEGFSNALLEMMSAGLPAVATDVGGNAEAVIDGACGLIVPPRDPSALGAALARLASAPELRARFGAAARARVEEHFTVRRCVAAYEDLYEAVLNRTSLAQVGEPLRQASSSAQVPS